MLSEALICHAKGGKQILQNREYAARIPETVRRMVGTAHGRIRLRPVGPVGALAGRNPTQPGVLTPGKVSPNDRPERALGSAGSVPRRRSLKGIPCFCSKVRKLFFECHLAMMNFLARNRRDNRLAHLAPFQGVRLIGSFPGVKTPG